MNPLNERLDEVGWASMPEEGRKFCWRAFLWMQQATAEIDRLTATLEQMQAEHSKKV